MKCNSWWNCPRCRWEECCGDRDAAEGLGQYNKTNDEIEEREDGTVTTRYQTPKIETIACTPSRMIAVSGHNHICGTSCELWHTCLDRRIGAVCSDRWKY